MAIRLCILPDGLEQQYTQSIQKQGPDIVSAYRNRKQLCTIWTSLMAFLQHHKTFLGVYLSVLTNT